MGALPHEQYRAQFESFLRPSSPRGARKCLDSEEIVTALVERQAIVVLRRPARARLHPKLLPTHEPAFWCRPSLEFRLCTSLPIEFAAFQSGHVRLWRL